MKFPCSSPAFLVFGSSLFFNSTFFLSVFFCMAQKSKKSGKETKFEFHIYFVFSREMRNTQINKIMNRV